MMPIIAASIGTTRRLREPETLPELCKGDAEKARAIQSLVCTTGWEFVAWFAGQGTALEALITGDDIPDGALEAFIEAEIPDDVLHAAIAHNRWYRNVQGAWAAADIAAWLEGELEMRLDT